MADSAVVVLSGGMDSAVLLYLLRSYSKEVHAISFDYGQRHKRELHAAGAIAQMGGAASHTVVDLSTLKGLLKGSSQTDPSVPVPHGHYTDESMKKTVVPNRNMFMLSVAVAHAIAIGAKVVAYGAHGGDHAIYPDCRPEFVDAMTAAVALCDWTPPQLSAPFLSLTKAEIACLGTALNVPFSETWSCYDPQEMFFGNQKVHAHCGRCGTCVERREAFKLAGIDDPTTYAP